MNKQCKNFIYAGILNTNTLEVTKNDTMQMNIKESKYFAVKYNWINLRDLQDFTPWKLDIYVILAQNQCASQMKVHTNMHEQIQQMHL